MDEPEIHTLRLLHEFREEFRGFREQFRDFETRTDERMDELVRLFAGEGIVARYAANSVDKRLEALEKRMEAVEGQR